MAKFTYDILFGSDVKPSIRSKLEARQNLARSSEFGEPVQYSGSFLHPMFTDADLGYDVANSTDFNSKLDLSSRIPWARMWAAIEEYSISPNIDELNKLAKSDPTAYAKDLVELDGEVKKHVDGVTCHVVGNNQYSNYIDQYPLQINESVENSETKEIINIKYALPENKNFNESTAGITQIESEDAGDYGLIRETTVTFHVHNYNDYVNIFQPFFLVPGARIFLDFGWSTAQIYDPLELVKKEQLGEDIFEILWGDGGTVDSSNGDMEVLMGVVSKYDTQVQDDGTFLCTVTMVSHNYALLDHNSSTDLGENKTIADFMKMVVNEKVEEYANNLGIKTDDLDIHSTNLLSDILPTVLAPNDTFKFMGISQSSKNKWRTTGGPRFNAIPEKNYHHGIYFDPLGALDSFQQSEEKEFTADYNRVTQGEVYITIELLENILNQYIATEFDRTDTEDENSVKSHLHKKAQNIKFNFYGGDSDKLDISKLDNQFLYKFHEDVESFQKDAGFTKDDDPKLDGKWGPTTKAYYERQMGQCTFNNYLYTRQVFMDNNGQFPFFKYPTQWKLDAQGNFESIKGDFGSPTSIPIYKLWVNLRTVLDIFKVQSIKSGLSSFVEKLNSESHGVFNFKLFTNTTKTDIRIADVNIKKPHIQKYLSGEDGNEKTTIIDSIFEFKAFSPNTIVSSLDLKSELGNDDYSNRMMIQGMSVGNLIFPMSDETLLDLAIKDIHAQTTDSNSDEYRFSNKYFNHLPILSQGKNTSKLVANKLKMFGTSTYGTSNSSKDSDIDNISKDSLNILLGRMSSKGFVVNKDQEEKDNSEQSSVAVTGKDNSPPPPVCPESSGLFPKNLCVNSLEEYFATKLRGAKVATNVHSVLLPWTLSFDIYGISGIVPGNRIQIDYLPQRYRSITYFIIRNVKHTLSGDGWVTRIDAQMTFSNHFNLQHAVTYFPNILPSPVLLTKLGYSQDQFEEIYEDGKEFFQIVPFNIAIRKSCMDPKAYNFLKTPPQSKYNTAWNANTDCAGNRPHLESIGYEQTTLETDTGEQLTIDAPNESSEDYISMAVGNTMIDWIAGVDKDTSCCQYCRDGDVMACKVPADTLKWLDQNGGLPEIGSKLDKRASDVAGYYEQEALWEQGLWWLSRESCTCIGSEYSRGYNDHIHDHVGIKYEGTVGTQAVLFYDSAVGQYTSDPFQIANGSSVSPPLYITNANGQIMNYIDMGSPPSSILDWEEMYSTSPTGVDLPEGAGINNITAITLPSGNKYQTEFEGNTEYFAALDHWMNQLTVDHGAGATDEWQSVVNAENIYMMLSPYDWKAHKLSQLDCDKYFPVGAYDLNQAREECEKYKKMLENLYTSTIEDIFDGNYSTPLRPSMGCEKHPFSAMCAETDRLADTFVALANNWAKTYKVHPNIYEQINLTGTLPTRLAAVTPEEATHKQVNDIKRSTGLTTLVDGEIYYVETETDQQMTLPESSYGCGEWSAMNYDSTAIPGDPKIHCFYNWNWAPVSAEAIAEDDAAGDSDDAIYTGQGGLEGAAYRNTCGECYNNLSCFKAVLNRVLTWQDDGSSFLYTDLDGNGQTGYFGEGIFENRSIYYTNGYDSVGDFPNQLQKVVCEWLTGGIGLGGFEDHQIISLNSQPGQVPETSIPDGANYTHETQFHWCQWRDAWGRANACEPNQGDLGEVPTPYNCEGAFGMLTCTEADGNFVGFCVDDLSHCNDPNLCGDVEGGFWQPCGPTTNKPGECFQPPIGDQCD